MVYYHKLWAKVTEKGLTQKALALRTGVSSATLTKMRKGEYVSLEVIDKIREVLDCGFGDILTSVPPESEVVVTDSAIKNYEEANEKVVAALKTHMQANDLTVSGVARLTGLSVNTVKSVLNDKVASAKTFLKLCKLGREFALLIEGSVINNATKQNTVYCNGNGNKRKKCWANQSHYLPEKGEYEHYCAFGFERTTDENGFFIATVDCPHPCNYKEFAVAKEKFDYQYRGQIEYIPAKGENK